MTNFLSHSALTIVSGLLIFADPSFDGWDILMGVVAGMNLVCAVYAWCDR